MHNREMLKNNAKASSIFFLISLISFVINIRIPFLNTFEIVSATYIPLQLMYAISICLIALKEKPSMQTLIKIMAFYAIYLLTTKLNGGNMQPIITNALPCFNLLMTATILNKKYNSHYFKSGLLFFLSIITINLATIVLFPDGLYKDGNNPNPYHFLGHRNDQIEYILPMFAMFFLSKTAKKSYTSHLVLLAALSMACVVSTWSMNSMLSILVLLLIVSIPTKTSISPIKAYITYAISFFAIVVNHLQEKIGWIIETIMHKSLTFTGRQRIWDLSIEQITKSPIIGYGYEFGQIKYEKIKHINSCHNYILDFMYFGGIIMISYVIYILSLLSKSIVHDKQSGKKSTAILCAYLTVWFATPIHIATIQLMLLCFFLIIEIPKRRQE